MVKPLGYYTSYNPQTRKPGILDRIQNEWGSYLENMTYEQKIVMRGALADFIANKPVWVPSPHPEEVTLVDSAIETAGVNWEIWDKDPLLVEVIQKCSELHEGDIEGLIEALTSQIRLEVYASRVEEWEVVSH